MQIVDVLRHKQKLPGTRGKIDNCLVRSIRLSRANVSAPFAIPLPNQCRLTRERFRCGEFCRIEIAPVTVLAAESWNPALGRNSGASDNENTQLL